MITLEEMRDLVCVGYTRHSGIEITQIGEGWAEGKVEVTEHHLNPLGAGHGGLIYCLADVIGGVAFRTKGCMPTTLSSSISYFRPFVNDKVIYARADVVKFGKTTAFIEIRLLNEQKIECARVSANYYNLEGRLSK